MERSLTFKDPEGHAVAAVLATPQDRTEKLAVLCHGFLSGKNSTTNTVVTRALLERGIATFRFDFFGQGETEGAFEQITVSRALAQALAALDFALQEGYSRIGLVGASFGGLVALLAAAQRSSLACLALKCPVVDFQEELTLEFGEEGIAEWRKTNTIPNILGGPGRIKLSYALYEDSGRHIGYDIAPMITAPTLIVQGDQDELVPPHQSKRLFDELKAEKSLRLLGGADHRFSREEDFRAMTDLIVNWLTRHLPAAQ